MLPLLSFLNLGGEKFGGKTSTEAEDTPTTSSMQQPRALRNQQDFGRKTKSNKEGSEPSHCHPFSSQSDAGPSPWHVRLAHLSRRLPPASIAAAQPQWGSPSKLPAPGSTSPRTSPQPKPGPTTVTRKSHTKVKRGRSRDAEV